MEKTFQDVLADIENNLIGKTLHSISGTAATFFISEVNYDNSLIVLDVQGRRKTWSFERLSLVWNEMYYRPAANVEVVFGGSGSSRNQVETIFASLAYVEWLHVDGKKCIAYVAEDTHEYGTLKHMDDDSERRYEALMGEANPRNPNIDDADDEPLQLPDNHLTDGRNILFYGVPGCGKSYTIKSQYCDDETHMERVVFHPDYTNADFVGQIMPVLEDGHIIYDFVPGPFTRILKTAYENPDEYYYLIVEEINRGNAPAIFGEIFQLLDRTNGTSEYGITNYEIAQKVFEDPNTLVKIPGNLYLLATMNTADQNVFTLDTAFKRRWTMVSIPLDFGNCNYADQPICGSNITWQIFGETINEKIIEYGKNNIGSEDNRLGPFFASAEDIVDENRFSEKVLMYLWNDAFKYDHDKIFKAEYQTLEDIIGGFKANKFQIFSDDIVFPTNNHEAVAPTTNEE